MKNKWIFYLLIVFTTQFIYAQKPFAYSVPLKNFIFAGLAKPVSIALLKFDGDEQLPISLYKELIRNTHTQEKFLIFSLKSIEQQQNALKLPSLSGQDPKVRKILKKELDISVIVFGERKANGKIQLNIMDAESSKILFTGEFEESINSSIEKDIVELLSVDQKTEYRDIGSLDLVLNPIDCTVKLDGKLTLSRENIELNAGRHYLTVLKDGYYTKSDSVLIVSNQKSQFTISLKEITGRIVIASIPPVSKIFRKGETIIKKYESSIDTIDINPGEYTLQLEAPGYKKKDKIVRVEENREMILDISMEKEELPATLSVTVNVKDSEILIKEGEQTKKTSKGELKNFPINKGKYKIIVSAQSYITQEKNIELFAGQSLLEQFTLQKTDGTISILSKVSPNDPMTGIINGQVMDVESKIGLTHFTITLEQPSLTIVQPSLPIFMDSRGNYLIRRIPPGQYKVYVSETGFIDQYKIIVVRENETSTVNFFLKKQTTESSYSINNSTNGTEVSSKTVPLIDMINIPSGEFKMGRNNGAVDEQPQHLVQISSFLIGKFEVTFNQYYNFCIDTGRDYDQYGDLAYGNYPVINVRWWDAVDFCTWLSTVTGKKYRLPTEAEWEYAARGGKSENVSLYSGSSSLELVGWDRSNSENEVHAVGTKLPNEFGIYDMSGNSWEWCSDWYLNSYYQKNEKINPQGAIEGKVKVLRGGSWNVDSTMCTVFKRQKALTSTIDNSIGFRVVLEEK